MVAAVDQTICQLCLQCSGTISISKVITVRQVLFHNVFSAIFNLFYFFASYNLKRHIVATHCGIIISSFDVIVVAFKVLMMQSCWRCPLRNVSHYSVSLIHTHIV